MTESPTSGIPEPEDMTLLRAKLERLPLRLGYPLVWLHPIYNAQYGNVSIVCWGGTLEQQQQVIAKLDNPPSPIKKPDYKDAVHAYAAASNPQINFNKLEDALSLLSCFDFAQRLQSTHCASPHRY